MHNAVKQILEAIHLRFLIFYGGLEMLETISDLLFSQLASPFEITNSSTRYQLHSPQWPHSTRRCGQA